ncbi:MAG TPA: hypothetical protein PLS62_11195 [Desulfobacteraceae bacterium]|nr:hypothetical protein [Desulfobacteraceae bacterium]
MSIENPKIDGRTRTARTIGYIKEWLNIAPIPTGKKLLADYIARNTAIEQAIFSQAVKDGLLDNTGKLNKQIEKHLLRFQTASKTALVELMKLENRDTQGANEAKEDIFNDVFDE